MLDPAQFMKFEPPQLFKLGLHGEIVCKDAYDFEWPTKEAWEQMNHSEPIYLKEIKITQAFDSVYSPQPIQISIHLSNGMNSPDFTASYAIDNLK